jgi:hypothetical protein
VTATAVEHEVRHIHDLLSLRHLLADRGGAAEELYRCDAAIADAYDRLAAIAQASTVGIAA